MSADKTKGIPFTPALSNSIDEWSRNIFERLRDWPVAKFGRWTRWDPGYLLLEIDHIDGGAVERIILYTSDEELTVGFGYWETHLPDPYGEGGYDADQAVMEAKKLIEGWTSGNLRTAVFADRSGNWCGSMIVEGDNLLPQLNIDWIRNSGPTRVEIRSAQRAEWRSFSILNDEFIELPRTLH